MIRPTELCRKTDRELEQRVVDFLASRNYPALRDLSVSVHDGQVVLSGCVSSFHEKQLATSCAQSVAGALEVINKIDVPSHLPLAGTPLHDG